jgi:hypothetical protein
LIRSQQRSIKNKDEAAYLKAAALRIKLVVLIKTRFKTLIQRKKAQTYVLKVHPSVLKTIEANEDGGSIDFNNLDTEDVDFQDVRRMMMKNNEIELNIAQITTIHKTVKRFFPKRTWCGLKPLF